MEYNNLDSHHRKSIRLKDYDYSKQGVYFITICTQGRSNLFGRIDEDQLIVNKAGRVVEKWWLEQENKFHTVQIDQYVIIPNHSHGTVHIVGADRCVCPESHTRGRHAGPPLPQIIQWYKATTTNAYIA